ncbi:MAG: DUF1127 domain-containing protein [Ramlibacter sp.]|nr:DUF1127 domain-containing protein [Ramlibacter sp.]MBX3658858.1 DUF1127 domain-containing protein [Ramlibacter sp.]MCW5649503.1 DUF1127 domain-containing protein [Ramlibacter sp.]
MGLMNGLWDWLLGAHAHQRLGEGELRGMTDRELADLGIGRSEVPALLHADLDAWRYVTWPGTGGRTGGSPAASPGVRARPDGACRLRRA